MTNSSDEINTDLDEATRERINQDVESINVEAETNLRGLKKRVDHEYDLNSRLRNIKDQAETLSREKAKERKGSRHSIPVPRRFDTEDQVNDVVKRLEAIKEKLPADIDWKI